MPNRAYAEMTGAASAADPQDGRRPAFRCPRGLGDHIPAGVGAWRDGQSGDGRIQACAVDPARRRNPARAGTGRVPAPLAFRASGCPCSPGSLPTFRRSAPSRNVSSSTCKRPSITSTCAGRLLFRRPGRPRHLYQRHARRMAGHRSGELHPRRRHAAGDRRRRRHGAGALGQGRSWHHPQRRHRSRSDDDDRRGAAGALHAPRFGQPRGDQRADPHHRPQPHAGRGRLRRSSRLGSAGSPRFFNSTPMAIAGVDASGRILRTNAPFCRCFPPSSTAMPSIAACGWIR